MKNIGGMNIQTLNNVNNKVSDNKIEVNELGSKPYFYELIHLGNNSKYAIDKSIRCCVYIYDCEYASIEINGKIINKQECFLGNVKSLEITSIKKATILIAYSIKNVLENSYKIFSESKAKKVEKPWGYEIWLTGEPSELFAFKRIYIKSGNKTSLQYHKVKRETNFIIDGNAILSYDKKGKYNDGEEFQISNLELLAPFIVDVFPNTIHRLEAVSDLMLLEVSTPELDDVIRLQDDSGRTHGRVNDEH